MALQIGQQVKITVRGDADIMGSYLGEFKDRSWFWNLADNELMWRVPAIQEAIAAPPGYLVLSADYSQIEVKLMAFLSQDPVLIAAINTGRDIHSHNAAEVFGKLMNFTYEDLEGPNAKNGPRYKELKEIRSRIKAVTFGVPYGAGAGQVAKQTGMTKEEAQEFIDAFFRKFAVLKQWLERMGNQALSFGFTSTPDGRKRFYVMPPKSDPDYDGLIAQIRRWAGNHPIQAANADILKAAIRKIYVAIRGGVVTGPRIIDARLALVVHDEIVMIVKEEEADIVEALMKKCMQEAYEAIVKGVMNKIDVSKEETWEKI